MVTGMMRTDMGLLLRLMGDFSGMLVKTELFGLLLI
jgi:hypothetical protein